VCDGHRRSLVEAELPHHALDVVLLDVHVVDEGRCQRFRSEQSTGGSTAVVYFFGGEIGS
jgi:hypothetical protein